MQSHSRIIKRQAEAVLPLLKPLCTLLATTCNEQNVYVSIQDDDEEDEKDATLSDLCLEILDSISLVK